MKLRGLQSLHPPPGHCTVWLFVACDVNRRVQLVIGGCRNDEVDCRCEPTPTGRRNRGRHSTSIELRLPELAGELYGVESD